MSGRNKLNDAVRGLGTHVGQLFSLADVDFDIFGFGVHADDLTFIDSISWFNEGKTTLLGGLEAIGKGFAGIRGYKDATSHFWQGGANRLEINELTIKDDGTLGSSQKQGTETENGAGRHAIDKFHFLIVDGFHAT